MTSNCLKQVEMAREQVVHLASQIYVFKRNGKTANVMCKTQKGVLYDGAEN